MVVFSIIIGFVFFIAFLLLSFMRKPFLKTSLESTKLSTIYSVKCVRMGLGSFILLLPAFSITLYCFLGSPNIPERPFSRIFSKNVSEMSPFEAQTYYEALFAQEPENGMIADKLAVLYFQNSMYLDAVNTYAEALRLNGQEAPRLVGYGLALVQYSGGIFTLEAQKVFEKAAKCVPTDIYPRIFIAASYAQEGDKKKAESYLENFLKKTPHLSPKERRKLFSILSLYKKH